MGGSGKSNLKSGILVWRDTRIMTGLTTNHTQDPLLIKDTIQPYQMRYRWVMLALVWLLYFACTLVTRSIAPLVTPILEDTKMSYSQMGLVLGAWSLVYIGVSAMGGALIDRWGINNAQYS